MSYQRMSAVIIITWVTLIAAVWVWRNVIKPGFFKDAPVIRIPDLPDKGYSPGNFFSRSGTLLVFVANIATIFCVIFAVIFPSKASWLNLVSISLPPWVNYLGAILFILNAVWGMLVMLNNPTYTPLYRQMPGGIILAMSGPYSFVRHPRYASEAWLNIILILFTGVWLPIVGMLGWAAMNSQARAEEATLLLVGGEEYARYAARTGRFFPKGT